MDSLINKIVIISFIFAASIAVGTPQTDAALKSSTDASVLNFINENKIHSYNMSNNNSASDDDLHDVILLKDNFPMDENFEAFKNYYYQPNKNQNLWIKKEIINEGEINERRGR